MRVSSYVLAVWMASSSMVTAFTPMSYASLKFAKTGLGSRLFAEDPNAPSAADAAGGGVGGALPSALAPFAALVAGRQALLRRDEVREQIAITENDLNKIKSDLANADTLISTTFGVAALTSAISLYSIFGSSYTGSEPVSTSLPSSSASVQMMPTPTVATTAAPKVETPPPAPKPPRSVTPKVKEAVPASKSPYDSLMSKLSEGQPESMAETPTPEVAIEAPKPEIKVEEVKPEVKEAKPEAPQSFMDKLMQKVETPEAKVEAPEAKVEAPEAKVEAPEAKVEVPEAKVEEAKPEVKVEETIPEVTVEEAKPEAPPPSFMDKLMQKVEEPEAKVEEIKPEVKVWEVIPEVKVEEVIPEVKEEVKAEAPPSFMDKVMQKVDEAEGKVEEAKTEAPLSFMDKLMQKKDELVAEKEEVPVQAEKKESLMDKLMKKVEAPVVDEVKPPGSGVLSNVLSKGPTTSGFVTPSVDFNAINQQELVITTGVGVAALGVFAALVAAGSDENSSPASVRQPMRPPNSKPMASSTGATYLDDLSTNSRSRTSGRQTPSSSSYLNNLSGGKPAKVKPSTIQKKVVKENAATYMGALSMGKVAPLKTPAPPPPPKLIKLATAPGKVAAKPSVTSSSSSTQAAPVDTAAAASSEMQQQSPPPPPKGPRSYLDQLSPPTTADSPTKGAKQPTFGRSYLDSLAPPENIMSQEPVAAAPDETPPDSDEMLPSIKELDESRILEEVSRW